jgi:hypothetical protein
MGDKPRSPDEHDLSGTGAPRSPDDRRAQPGAVADAPADRAVTTGMRSTSQPASADEVTINRSGSGGSGGPVDADPSVEGSTGQSMSELLGGEDESGPPGS